MNHKEERESQCHDYQKQPHKTFQKCLTEQGHNTLELCETEN